MGPFDYDAVIIGAGPNGLAAAITLAKAGSSVLVVEARATPGGGARTAAITLPGFFHDICSSVHPLGAGSPFFRSLPLEEHGLSWVHPSALLAHPFEYGPPVMLERSLDATCAGLFGDDARAYRALIEPFSGASWDDLAGAILGPIRIPRNPFLMARFGLSAIRSARGLTESLFRDGRTRALFAGMACHSMLPLDEPPSAAFGLVLAAAGHTSGWPIARGGSQAIIEALCSYLASLGGVVVTGRRISSMADLPRARAYLFDVTPRQLVQIAGNRLPSSYRADLLRYRYGPGAFKLDYALCAPVPWRSPECLRACTVHLGGHIGALAASEEAISRGRVPDRPYVIVVQPTLFDPSRAPEGKHVAWVYCHVPHGSRYDMTERIEDQIERFAPGFRDVVLERRAMTPVDLEHYNPNYVGGDINGGLQDLGQLFTRPRIQAIPYSTPVDDIFLCSSSTPPGGGVHGMCGYWAARAALAKLRGQVGYADAPQFERS
ncbi:MAG: NAD(P)/FAD-dependent oxidoreductase [Polyangiaceae bacterium]|nr:NAD(P)/FAD-dependent oxidoreductase [Polyangiaceae bacterium]